MNLPVRILPEPPSEPVISVDGVYPAGTARGLNLSHWPGNSTPAALKRDLSTGIALAFAELPAAEQEALAGGATALVNNHYDTDGVLSLFAIRHPEEALPHAERLLEIAAAGDFYAWPNDHALAVDAIVGGLSQSPASPLAAPRAGGHESDATRWERCTRFLLGALPGLLAGELQPFLELWEPELEAARADRALLERCERVERDELELATWITPGPVDVGRDPGRHALFGATPHDRVLVLQPSAAGTRCRLILSTRSWFDLVTERKPARPDLESLVQRLNELEGAAPDTTGATGAPEAWRTQPSASASPELWFGGADLPSFEERNALQTASRLTPDVIAREIELALG